MADISLERTAPVNLDVERLVLGYILTAGRLDVDLEPEDFYMEGHRIVWRTMQSMLDAGSQPDMVSVLNTLRSNGKIDEVGGVAYLMSLTDGIGQFHEPLAQQYVEILREHNALRVGISVGHELMMQCYEKQPFRPLIDSAFGKLDEALARMDRKAGPRPISDIVGETLTTVERIADKKGGEGYKTGFKEFDRIVHGGLQRKNLHIVAGRPGHGKTSFLLGQARRVAKQGVPGVIFSLEMSDHELCMRLLADIAQVSLVKMTTGFMNKEEWGKIARACGELSRLPIWIDDSSSVTVSDMRSRIRRLMTKIETVWVDYLQLVNPPRHLIKAADVEKISSISIGLKNMAKSMDVAVIAAAQLSRASEKRRDQTPKLSDLRQSGQIEQDADLVTLLYRDEVSKPTEENGGIAQVIIGKHRNGATGSFQMVFLKEFSAFDDMYRQDGEERGDRWYE